MPGERMRNRVQAMAQAAGPACGIRSAPPSGAMAAYGLSGDWRRGLLGPRCVR